MPHVWVLVAVLDAVAEDVVVEDLVDVDDAVAVADMVDVRVVSVLVLVAVARVVADPDTDLVLVPVARVAVVVPDTVAVGADDLEARGDAEGEPEAAGDLVAVGLGKAFERQATCAPMAPKCGTLTPV